MTTPGARFREAVKKFRPLQVVGAVNAYTAMLAEKTGFQAIYVSGSGVATASFGMPDLGITTMSDVVEDVRRITSAISVPVLVDIDTGFGSAFNIARTIRELERAGAAAVHIEDQVQAKRCGHRPGKQVVSTEEMVDRIRVAVGARKDSNFVIMARTDAYANEGLEGAIARAKAYVEAGADMIFSEALASLDEYRAFASALGESVPLLANMTEFGKTPLFHKDELAEAGVGIVLYPLSAHRAQAQAAVKVFEAILKDGTQANVVNTMQTRQQLYEYLDYYRYENALDELQAKATASKSSSSQEAESK